MDNVEGLPGIPLPYSSYIKGGIFDGLDIAVVGKIQHNSYRFSINLTSTATIHDGDVALHFNPRFDAGMIVRNHRQGKKWGTEEIRGIMPLFRGKAFNLHLKVAKKQYEITINGNHFCNFNHRLPIDSVHYLTIAGDVMIDDIVFNHPPTAQAQYQPGCFIPPNQCPPPYPGTGPGHQMTPLFNPPVPLITPVQGQFLPGRIIAISGIPLTGANRFCIDLATGLNESSDLALHFDVRFSYGNDQNVVVRNHFMGGNWGPEEKSQAYFPFYPGANFDVLILCDQRCLKVAVNNQHFIEFNHRMPYQNISYLHVKGDVKLYQCRFQY